MSGVSNIDFFIQRWDEAAESKLMDGPAVPKLDIAPKTVP